MKNYLISNTIDLIDVNGAILGKRICDVSDSTFPVSNDYEWKEYSEYFDVYTNQWYWADNKPNEYVPPAIPVDAAEDQPNSSGLENL